MDKDQQQELGRMLVKSLDEGLGRDEFEKIDRLLATDNEALDFYIHFMRIYSRFAKPGKLFAENQRRSETHLMFDSQLWKDLALDEKNAPAVLAEPQPDAEVISLVQHQKTNRQFNRVSLVSIILSAAAILLVVLFAYFTPVHNGMEVAILADSIGAEWAAVNEPMVKGIRLATSETPLVLKKGFAEIRFDNQTRLVLEAPAEIELLSKDQVKLTRGSLYAVIGPEAAGFTVNTQNARIIDLGTEFAVKTDSGDTTELHVIKGQTSLLAGHKKLVFSQVGQGAARLVRGPQADVFEIPCHGDEFVRKIDSGKKVVWRGQNLDAAHLIAGGSGTAPGAYFGRIDSLSGQYKSGMQSNAPYNPSIANDFKSVSPGSVVDGFAVPCGPTIISSEGHRFDFGKTTRCLSWDVVAYNDGRASDEQDFNAPVFASGGRFGNPDSPVVLMHSNVLVTLDLRKIQGILPEQTIRSFTSRVGITETVKGRSDAGKVNFYVLIDGQVRSEKANLTVEDGLPEIEVEIQPQDRFLTLAVTEAGEQSKLNFRSWANDFFYLIRPEFTLSADE